MAHGEERTEKATPQRLKKARKEGQISHSHEVGQWATLLVASFVLPASMKKLLDVCSLTLVKGTALIVHPDMKPAMTLFRKAGTDGAMAVAPMIGVILMTAMVSAIGQSGFHPAPKLLLPKFNRLNPLHGIKRMFGAQGAWNLTKSLVKTIVLGFVTWLSVKSLVPTLIASGSLPLNQVIRTAGSATVNLMRVAAVAGLLLSVADMMTVRRRNNKATKMTKQEVKEEFKQSEGDPHVRGQIRARALAMARNRMMADVPTADVVLVNPTHVAIALKYDPAKGAPRVVAKGADHVAAKIREIALANRVPLVEQKPLARALYATCEVGQEIPEDMYHAVATVLAFLMRLKRKGSVAGMHRMPGAA